MNMRLLFATDIHGNDALFDDLSTCVRRLQPDLLICGGDCLPDGDPDDPVATQVRFLHESLRPYLLSIRRHCPGTEVATIFGNHDWLCTARAMEDLQDEGLVRILRPDRPVSFGGISFYGYWSAPPCPFPVKDFERLDWPGQQYPFGRGVIWDERSARPVAVDAGEHLGQLPSMREEVAGVAPAATAEWVFVSHAPPLQSDLDLLPEVGHVGSRSVEEFLLQRQPTLSLHGHIHESPGLSGRFWQRFGRTIAVNPGQRHDELAAVLIELTDQAATLHPLHVDGAAGDAPVTLPRTAVARRSA